MSSITVDFEFEIGDTVYYKTAQHDMSSVPRKYTVLERGAVECHGGVQRFYRLTSYDMKDPLSGIPCIALTKDMPAYSPRDDGYFEDRKRITLADISTERELLKERGLRRSVDAIDRASKGS